MNADDLADQIVASCREQLERGETVDPEAVIRAHPEMAEELRVQFAALRLLERAFARDGESRVADAPSLVGRALGPFRLASRIGVGGMGTVYAATVETRSHGLDVGTRVALKVIHPHLLARDDSFQRFLREAEIGGRVRHENVVRTLLADEVVDASGTLRFLVMEHVEGRTLREVLADLTRVPEELCRHVGREIAKALAAIHAAGAVHRDVKPDNVVVTPDNVVKVMDLGVALLAKEAARLSQTGAFVGSVRYAAPEQFRSREGGIDGRADLYALGLTLYELATGTHPFDDDEFAVVMRRQMDDVPRPAGEMNPQLSPFFEEVLRRLLAKDRGARFDSATGLLDVLEQGESSAWWQNRAKAIRADTRRPLRRIRIQRETALYGRDPELARLRALFDAAKAGDGQVALVEGEAGIGKSRLVDEFVGALAASGEDVNFLYGSYPPGGAATASGAFTSAYREHVGDDEASIRAALPQTPLLVPAFAALLRGDVAPEGTEKLTKDSLQTVFVHATRSFAETRTTIVLIDDLHFAPEEGRALFAALALAVPGHRILLVGGARPSLDEKWLAGIARLPHLTRVPLPRLGANDLVRVLRDALGSQHLAEELAGRIATESDGNPFFVFEILRGLREGRFITRRSDGTWARTSEIRDIRVPSSIVDVVQARVSELDRGDREVLEVAACAGFEFDPGPVGDVLQVPPIPLLQRLGAIEKRHRLVRSVGRRFAFDHHQVMEVLYSGISEPLREAYHAAIGGALEARSGAGSADPPRLEGALCVDLTDHFLRGGRGGRALRYLDAAVAHLEGSYLGDAAVLLLERALAEPRLVTGRERVRLFLRKASLLDLLGRRSMQCAALEEAVPLADEDGDAALRAQARVLYGGCLWRMARIDEVVSISRAAQELARLAGDRKLESAAAGNLGSAHWSRNRLADAQQCYAEMQALARQAGDRHGEAGAAGNLGLVLRSLGRFAEAQECAARHLAIVREIGYRRGEALALANLGDLYWPLGRLAEARAALEQSLRIARQIGDRWTEAIATGTLGNVLGAQGRIGESLDHYERSLGLCRDMGHRQGEGVATGCVGDALRALGRLGDSVERYDRQLALGRELGDRRMEGYALHALGLVAADAGDAATAERNFGEALRLRRAVGHRDGEATTLAARGALFARSGRDAEARADLVAAVDLARDVVLPDVELQAAAHLLLLPGGDVSAVTVALASHEGSLGDSQLIEVRLLLWRATGDFAHLQQAALRLGRLVAHAPPQDRESMLTNVPLHRDIAAAAQGAGLALATEPI